MVAPIDSLRSGRARDRGQLVLVGAVAIAFVLVGLVVLFNGVVFTENVGSEGAVVDAKGSGSTAYTIERGVSSAAHTVHMNNKYEDSASGETRLENDLEESAEEFNTWNRLQEGETRGVVTNVSFEGVTGHGTRIVQNRSSDFTAADGSTTWDPIDTVPDEQSRIGTFVLRVEDPAVDQTMRITVEDENGVTRAIQLEGDSGSNTLELNNFAGTPIDDSSKCTGIDSGADSEIIIRLSAGIVAQQPECTFSFVDPRANQSIEFAGSTTSFTGTYNITVREQLPDDSRFDGYGDPDTSSGDEPHLSRIARSAEYTIAVDGTTIQQKATTTEVEHYP